MSSPPRSVRVSAPINIALVKYWGKRDEGLKLPLNDSLSTTVDVLRAETTVTLATEDSVEVNGSALAVGPATSYGKVFAEARRLLARLGHEETQPHFQVSSVTNFPTSAGLASSAAGFAAIALGLGRLFPCLAAADPHAVSKLARLGSGSASRSVMGGWCQWRSGEAADGSDSFAEQVCAEPGSLAFLSGLRAVVVEVSAAAKEVGSTPGMRRTVQTSELFPSRLSCVPGRLTTLKAAISSGDFGAFAAVVEAESDQLHAVCLDSRPPLRYLNKESVAVQRLVEHLNASSSTCLAAYTFDAGPNAVVLCRDEAAARAFFGLLTAAAGETLEDATGGMEATPWSGSVPAVGLGRGSVSCVRTSSLGAPPNDL